jgi:hypothetical protein
MKMDARVKELETQVAQALRDQLHRVDFVEVLGLETEDHGSHSPVSRPDLLVRLNVQGKPITLLCDVKEPGHPRQVRSAIAQLHGYMALQNLTAVPVVAASWLSPGSRQLCEESNVGWLDLAGNCRLAFEGVFIERETAERPKVAARAFRSIFSPKSGQVLRVLLRDPAQPWKVNDLAEASGVSLGHVSNVRSALIDREWASADEAGLRLTAPDALLDAWRDEYEPARGERTSWYTILHGRELETTLRNALVHGRLDGRAMLGSLSAAHWLAPYARGGNTTIYADATAVPGLVEALKLRSSSGGANVEIIVPDDPDLLNDRVEIADAPPVSPPVLTYLDLSRLDDRGREAADHLRGKLLTWH